MKYFFHMRSKGITTYFLLFTVILLWGLNWPMNKIGMEYIPAIWHAAIRLSIGTASMFLLFALFGQLKLPKKADLYAVLTIGLLQMGLFSMFINLGLNYVDVGRSAMLVYTIPLWATPLAILLFKEKINTLKIAGLGLGLMGVLILLNPWTMDWSKTEIILGNAFLLGAAISMAVSILLARNITWISSPFMLLPWQLLVGTLPVILIAFLLDPHPVIEWNSTSIPAMLYTAILATAIGNGAITIVSRNLPSITVSVALLGVPLTAIVSAICILEETMTLSMKLSMVLITGGLICVALSSKNKVHKT